MLKQEKMEVMPRTVLHDCIERWVEGTRNRFTVEGKRDHFAYREIVGQGRPIVHALIEELNEGGPRLIAMLICDIMLKKFTLERTDQFADYWLNSSLNRAMSSEKLFL